MKKNRSLLFVILLALFLSACSQATQTITTPTSSPEPVQQGETAPPPTPEPSPTAQTGSVLLVTPPGIDPQPYQSLLDELASASGWLVETSPGPQPAELTANLRVVVMPAPLPNYAELLNAAPQVQFIIFSPVDLNPAPNLTVVRQRTELQAFAAGYISELISPDYRAAGLLPADGMLGAQLEEAFVNGGRYYCGMCAPGWPLNLYYPAVASLPAASDGAAWQAAAVDLFDNKKVDVFFLTPDAARPEVASYLQGKAQIDRPVLVIGTQPPLDGLANQWAASVRFDDLEALREAWQVAAQGQSAGVLEVPLLVDHVDESLLSTGRMRLVDELLVEIGAGRVHPFTVQP